MKHAILIVIAILLAAFILFWIRSQRTVAGTVRVGDTTYRAERVESLAAQAKGLSGRPALADDEAMLFVFSRPAMRYFWMKDMQFPLDVLWIKEGRIIGLEANIPYPAANLDQIVRFSSPLPADAVLEMSAGQIAKQGMSVGDQVYY